MLVLWHCAAVFWYLWLPVVGRFFAVPDSLGPSGFILLLGKAHLFPFQHPFCGFFQAKAYLWPYFGRKGMLLFFATCWALYLVKVKSIPIPSQAPNLRLFQEKSIPLALFWAKRYAFKKLPRRSPLRYDPGASPFFRKKKEAG